MSLFKERQASAKKLIQLQNEILALKAQLQNSQQTPSEPCEDCDELRKEIESILEKNRDEKNSLQEEIATLKTDLKKLRSENTRLKNKINKDSENV